jgi:hypothetical protein
MFLHAYVGEFSFAENDKSSVESVDWRLMNQKWAVRGSKALPVVGIAMLKTMLELESLKLLGYCHQNKKIERDTLVGRHCFGAIAQSGRKLQNHLVKSLFVQSHRFSL